MSRGDAMRRVLPVLLPLFVVAGCDGGVLSPGPPGPAGPPGLTAQVKAGFPRFVEKTSSEKKNLFYEFSINGDEIFCREGYESAEGVLAHLDNIGAPLAEMLRDRVQQDLGFSV